LPILQVAQAGRIKPNRFSIAANPIIKGKDKRELFDPSGRGEIPCPPLQYNWYLGRKLVESPKKFQTEKALVTQSFLATHLGLDRRSFAGNEARG
jgi:hypothetical protein